MDFQPFIILYFFISTTVLLPSTTAVSAFPPTAGHSFPPTPGDSTDYIRASCNTTRYPETCFTTLSNYSTTVNHDASRLALVAIHVALFNATNMTDYIHNISLQADSGNTTTELSAIRDCVSVFHDAVDQIHKSRREMRQLGWNSGESLRFRISNVQTWMSAALTDEDTCVDGFEEVVVGGGVKAEVCDRVVAVMEVTSNALALVNRYAETVSG